jgi:AcrR family transcriptional regulator
MSLTPRSPRRKVPKQDRSRATVDAILQAAAKVFVSEGFEAATTARIAELAGVSIGSLYQYFPNKEALIAALGEHEMKRMTNLLATRLAGTENASPRAVIRSCVRAVLDYYESEPELQRVLVEHVPRISGLDRIHLLDLSIVDLVRGYFEGQGGIQRKNPHAAYFIVVHAVRAVAFGYLFQKPAGLDADTLTDELTDMVASYLVPKRR